jgi:hypothetical protein
VVEQVVVNTICGGLVCLPSFSNIIQGLSDMLASLNTIRRINFPAC